MNKQDPSTHFDIYGFIYDNTNNKKQYILAGTSFELNEELKTFDIKAALFDINFMFGLSNKYNSYSNKESLQQTINDKLKDLVLPIELTYSGAYYDLNPHDPYSTFILSNCNITNLNIQNIPGIIRLADIQGTYSNKIKINQTVEDFYKNIHNNYNI